MAAPPYKRPMPMAPKKDLMKPPGFGGKSAGPPPPDTPDPDGDDDMPPGGAPPAGGGGVVLTLDQMNYHDEPHACALCKHYGQDGMCEVAQSQVNPDGGCSVFASQDEGDSQQAPMSAGMPGGGMPMGGGAPPSGLPS